MKKIAIVIKGKADCGKTSTIREVVKIIYKHLKEKFIYEIDFCSDDKKKSELEIIEKLIEKLIEEAKEEEEEKKEKEAKKEKEEEKPEDIRLIIDLNDKTKIGIESMGDYHHEDKPLFKSLTEFVKEPKCNIIICPTKTQGPTTEVVKSLCNEYDIVWINKNKENESRKELDTKERNKELAKEIYNKYIKCFIESDKSTK